MYKDSFLQQVSHQDNSCRQWKVNSPVHWVQTVTVEIQMQKKNPWQCSFYKQKQRNYFTQVFDDVIQNFSLYTKNRIRKPTRNHFLLKPQQFLMKKKDC